MTNKLTIEQMQKVINLNRYIKTSKCNQTKDLMDLFDLVKNLVLKQTNLETLELVEKVLNLYNSYKEDDWFKEGIRQVLENGTFPKTFPEAIREITVPSTTWPDPLKQNPYYPVCPNYPIITWASSVNLNDYKGISEVLDSIEDMLK